MSLLSIIFLLLHFTCALSPDPKLWGVDSWSYMPGVFSYLFLFAGIMPLLPRVRAEIRPLFDRMTDTLIKVPLPIFTILFGVLLYVLSQQAFLSGDGLLRIRNMTAGTYIIAAEPLETFLHQIIFDAVNSVYEVSAQNIFRFISIICGMITFYLAAGYIKDVFSYQKHRNFMAMLLLTSGAIMLFFGYVETYSITTAVMIIYLLSTTKMLIKREFTYVPMITISFAVFLHTSSFVFLPAALYAYFALKKDYKYSASTIVRLFSIFVIFTLFTVFAVYISDYPFSKLISDLSGESHILPLFTNEKSYGIFSIAHLTDIMNLLFLTAPAIVAIPTILIKLPRIGFTPELKFLGISSLFALLFVGIIKSDLGMARDWDLFALAAFPITIFSATALIRIYEKGICRVALPLFIICIVHTAPWIMINSSYKMSIDRSERQASIPHWSGHSKAILYDAVANEYYKDNKQKKALELSVKAYENEQNNRFLFNIATGYNSLKQQDSALKYFEILEKEDFENELTLRHLSRLYIMKDDYLNARNALEDLFNLSPDDLGVLYTLGSAYYELTDYGSAVEAFTAILQTQPDHFDAAVKLAESYFSSGQYPQAEMLFVQALKKEPHNPEFHYYLAVCYYKTGELNKAALHAANAKKYGFFDTNLIDQLIGELK